MRNWLLVGLLVLFISTIVAWITNKVEVFVFFNEIVGILSLVIALYIHIGLQVFHKINDFRSNHEQADYQAKNRLKYKLICFGLPNLIVGEIINQTFDIWN